MTTLGLGTLGTKIFGRIREPAPNPIVKRIVCLANSRKRSGRCIAGKESTAEGSKWVRPVSERFDQEVSEAERQYKDKSEPQVLDIIDVPLKEYRPRSHQSENWVLAPRVQWTKAGRTSWLELFPLSDYPLTLWKTGCSSFNGLNDRVSLADCEHLNCSL